MSREIITIQIGQSGVQMGSAIWELYCMEHGLNADGSIKPQTHINNWRNSLFYENREGKYTPRSIFMDLEPSVIDEIRTGSYRDLFNPSFLITGMEDAAGNYARGFFNLGRLYINQLLAAIRKHLANCDNFSLFEIMNSYSGGTGSGLTALLLEKLNDNYNKKCRVSTGIFPSRTFSECTVGPYNALLYTHTTFNNLDCGILVDNESMYKSLLKNLGAEKPSFSVLNRLLAQIISSIFVSSRYSKSGSQNMSVEELMINSVPYPRIHFPVLAYAPLVNHSQVQHEFARSEVLTQDVFSGGSHFLTCPISAGRYISCCLLYRGQISPSQVYSAIASVKSAYDVRFVDWCPTGFKVNINSQPAMSSPRHVLATSGCSLCMLSGNIGIKFAWQNLRCKYEHLVSKRSFMHWFVGEGLEEEDFMEANEDIIALEKDYEEIGQDTEVSDKPETEKLKSNASSVHHNSKHKTVSICENNQNNATSIKYARQMQSSYCKKLYEEVLQKIGDSKVKRKAYHKLHKLQGQIDPINGLNDSPCQSTTLVDLNRLYSHPYPIQSNLTEIQNVICQKYQLANRNLSISHIDSVSCDPAPDKISCQETHVNKCNTLNFDNDDSSRVTSASSSFLF